MHHSKKDDSESLPFDLTEEERLEWEKERLKETLELTDEDIDPAPFQLTPKTSLFRVHSIFSMLQLVKAYVTDCGRLVGVVSLTDVSVPWTPTTSCFSAPPSLGEIRNWNSFGETCDTGGETSRDWYSDAHAWSHPTTDDPNDRRLEESGPDYSGKQEKVTHR